MWNVDPRWPPPAEVRYRPHQVAYVFAAVLPVVLLLRWPPRSGSSGDARRRTRGPAASTRPAQPGIRPASRARRARRPVLSRLRQHRLRRTEVHDLDLVRSGDPDHLRDHEDHRPGDPGADLVLLRSRADDERGQDQWPARRRRQESLQDVQVTPCTPIMAGADFVAVLEFSGDPATIKSRGNIRGRSPSGVDSGRGAGECVMVVPGRRLPFGPGVDGCLGPGAGRDGGDQRWTSGLPRQRHDPESATWHWLSQQPMATYPDFVGSVSTSYERVWSTACRRLHAVCEHARTGIAQAGLRGVGGLAGGLLRTYGADVRALPVHRARRRCPRFHRFGFGGLESRLARSTARASILDQGFATPLVAHGSPICGSATTSRSASGTTSSTTRRYASWAQWGYLNEHGGENRPNADFERAYQRATNAKPGVLADHHDRPMQDHLFDAVYHRGPMVLQALRNVWATRRLLLSCP